jgi:polyhydroxybutyrate depolymerase
MRRCVAAALVLAALLGARAAHADDGGQRFTLSWDGRARSYLLYAPSNVTGKMPLVVALHGASQDGAAFAEETQFAAAGAAMGMAVVFPDGSGAQPGRLSWNAHFCCGVGAAEQVDDIGFIGALIEHIAATLPIDRKRVYATGMSNGGMLSYQLAAAHPEWFAAIAPVSATIGGTSRNGDRFVIAAPDRPVPVMIIHGRKDPFVLFDGGSSSPISFPKRSNMGVAEALSLWTAADGCAAAPALSEPAPGRLRRSVYSPCRDGDEIVLWEIEDGEHNWPANVRFPAPDGAPRSAAAEILAFFASHNRE